MGEIERKPKVKQEYERRVEELHRLLKQCLETFHTNCMRVPGSLVDGFELHVPHLHPLAQALAAWPTFEDSEISQPAGTIQEPTRTMPLIGGPYPLEQGPDSLTGMDAGGDTLMAPWNGNFSHFPSANLFDQAHHYNA